MAAGSQKQYPVFPAKFNMSQKKSHLSALPATDYGNTTSQNICNDYLNSRQHLSQLSLKNRWTETK